MWAVILCTAYIPGYGRHYFAYAIITLLLIVGRFFSEGSRRISPAILASFLALSLSYPALLRFYTDVHDEYADEILAEPAISKILPTRQTAHLWDDRAIFESCDPDDFFLVETRGATPHLRLVKNGSVTATTLYAEGSDTIALDCAHRFVIAADHGKGMLHLLDHDTLRILDTIPLPARSEPVFVEYNAARHLVAVSTQRRTVILIDLTTKKILSESKVGSEYFHLTENGDTLYYGNRALGIAKLDPVNHMYHTVRETKEFDGPLSSTIIPVMEYLEGAGIAAIAPIFGDTVFLFDDRTLKPRGKVRIGYGPRGMYYFPKKRTLFVQTYFDGRISAIDIDTGSVVKSRLIGARGRTITASHDGKNIYLMTNAGGFKLDMETFLSAAQPRR